MSSSQTLQQQIADEQNRYQSILVEKKEFSNLKSIKNNIKKMQRQLYLLQKEYADTSTGKM